MKGTDATQLVNALRSNIVSLHSIADKIEQWMDNNHVKSSRQVFICHTMCIIVMNLKVSF